MKLNSSFVINWTQAGDAHIKAGRLSYLCFYVCWGYKFGGFRYVILWFHSLGLAKLHHGGGAQGQDYCSFSVLAMLKSKSAGFTASLFSKG